MTWAERWATIERFLPQLWDGTLVTLQLVGLAVLIGLFFAIPLVSVMAGGLYEELRLADGQTSFESGRVEFV